MTSAKRLLTAELVVCVLPCTILWVITAPAMVLVLIKAGPAGSAFGWFTLWVVGGLLGLVAVWAAALNEAGGQRALVSSWQWVGLIAGIATSLSLVVPELMGTPTLQLHGVIQVVVVLPSITALRLVARHEWRASAERTG
jgi:hypothetical protein